MACKNLKCRACQLKSHVDAKSLDWASLDWLIENNFSYWSNASSLATSMGLGSQKGWFANRVNAPNKI